MGILKFRYVDGVGARGDLKQTTLLRRAGNQSAKELENNLLEGLDENLNSYSGREISSPLTLTTSCSTPSPSPPSPNMDLIQDHIRLLMEGRPYEELHEFCDFTLAQQNEATAAKGVPPSAPADFQPVVKKSVCYIVAAVLFNENNEVLMMQEAKSSCAGQWYLPAGRMERMWLKLPSERFLRRLDLSSSFPPCSWWSP